jgi:predicted transcriptional regulator
MAEKRGKGRPAFKPTALHRRRVEEYVCAGMSQDAIAKVLGISDETLRKHFTVELETGAQRRRAEVISLLFANARKGNVSAQKKLEEMSKMAVAHVEFAGVDDQMATPPARPQKLQRVGKKEEAAEKAASMVQDDEWGADVAASLGIGSATRQ